jgi:hypothetical protein
MTFADIVILIVTITIVGFIIYRMIKHKDDHACSKCAYAKNCVDDSLTNKKTIS